MATMKVSWADGQLVYGVDMNDICVQINTNTAAIAGLLVDVVNLDDAMVHNSGDETVAGVKTFTSVPVSNNPATTSNQLVRKNELDAVGVTAASGVTNAAAALAAAGSANANANGRLAQPTGTGDSTTFARGDGAWAVPPGGGGGSISTLEQNIGDGVNSTFVITHGWGTRDVGAGVQYNDGFGSPTFPEVWFPTKDTAAIGFRTALPPTPNQFLVSMLKRGQTDVTPPTTPALTAGTITTTTIPVTVSGSTDAGGGTLRYIYILNGIWQNTIPTTATTFTYSSLTPGTMYTLTVISVDVAGNPSAASTAITPTTLTPTAITLNVRSTGNRVTSGMPADSFTVASGSNRRAWAFVFISTTQDISGATAGGAGYFDTLQLNSSNGSSWDYVDLVVSGQFTASRLGAVIVFKKDNVATGAHTLTPNVVKSGITINSVMIETVVLNNCDLVSTITALKENSTSGATLGLTITNPVDSSWCICATVGAADMHTGASPATTYNAGGAVTGEGDFAMVQDGLAPSGTADRPFTTTASNRHASYAFEQKAA